MLACQYLEPLNLISFLTLRNKLAYIYMYISSSLTYLYLLFTFSYTTFSSALRIYDSSRPWFLILICKLCDLRWDELGVLHLPCCVFLLCQTQDNWANSAQEARWQVVLCPLCWALLLSNCINYGIVANITS